MKTKLTLAALIFSLTTLMSCKKDALVEQESESFEEVLRKGGSFEPVVNKKQMLLTQTTSLPMDSGNWVCNTYEYDILQGEPDFPLYDPKG